MGKKIIFCLDGTWDTPQSNTNVYKMFKAILSLEDQLTFYDDGLGTDGFPLERLIDGALGNGLFEKIKASYKKIAEVYKKGDDIFLFGFSRGAYIARSLAGMISICGLPALFFDEDLVQKAFKAYRHPYLRKDILKSLNHYELIQAPIKMVGVWETVGSLGIPSVFGKIGPLYGFLDTSLHPNIEHAYHAVAIDEKRQSFHPTLWSPSSSPKQTLEQVWFPGVHGDVGGGYKETGLSDICLGWMMKKASQLGLQMKVEDFSTYTSFDAKQALSQIHASWNPFWLFPKERNITPQSTLSNSTLIKTQYESSYRPANLEWKNDSLSSCYQIQDILSHLNPLAF